MLYLYAGATSAVLFLAVIVMWIATSNYALVWKRTDKVAVLPKAGRYSYSDAVEKYLVIGDGGLSIRFRERRYSSEQFEAGDSVSSLYWYFYAGGPGEIRVPAWNSFLLKYKDRHAFIIELPLWAMAAPLAILPGIQSVQLIRWRRRQREIRLNKLCPDCGYDCRATPDRCPECGKVLRSSSLVDVSALEGVADDEEPRDDPDEARAAHR